MKTTMIINAAATVNANMAAVGVCAMIVGVNAGTICGAGKVELG